MGKKILKIAEWPLTIIAIAVFVTFKLGLLPLSIACGPERAAASLYVKGTGLGDVKVGGGVLLGNVDGGVTNIYFLTARHTVTHNRNYLGHFLIYYRKGLFCKKINLSSTADRWMTASDSQGVDCAWIRLSKDELPSDIASLCFIEIKDVMALSSKTPSADDVISMVDSVSKYTGRFLGYRTKTVHNKESRTPHNETLRVGIVNEFTPITFSGSPVFAKAGGDSPCWLIGTTAISNKGDNQTGYVPISRVIYCISDSCETNKAVKLINCPWLW